MYTLTNEVVNGQMWWVIRNPDMRIVALFDMAGEGRMAAEQSLQFLNG